MPKPTTKLFDVTKKNIKRNRLLSFSTIFVTTIVFIISSFFISIAIMGQKAVKYYEQKSQVIIFLSKETPEAEILTLRDKLYDAEKIESIKYISQAEALEIYREDFEDNPDLISTVTADSLPPSLEIRAKTVDDLLLVIDDINTEKQTNAYIDEVLYFKDVVKNLKALSRIINIGTVVLISALSVITFLIIRITIGFNINAHKEEIQVMHLMGSTDRFIKLPYVIEGAAYGIIGGFISATFIIVPWYIIISFIGNTEYALWISQMLSDFGLGFLKSFNITFVLIYYLVHILVGLMLGTISSISSSHKYLELVRKDE